MKDSSFYTEPVVLCSNCGNRARAEWFDIGFGPYSQQASPHICSLCGWVELGCPAEKCTTKCISYETCKGRAINDTKLVSLVTSLFTLLDKGLISYSVYIEKISPFLKELLANIAKEIEFKGVRNVKNVKETEEREENSST